MQLLSVKHGGHKSGRCGLNSSGPSSVEIENIMDSSESCKQPFTHCCLGRCRREEFKIGEMEFLLKPVHKNDKTRSIRQFSSVLSMG